MHTDLSYLLGSYFGDGHVDYRRYAYQFILTTEDHDFLVYNADICKTHFGKYGTITPVKNYYKLVICSKKICDFLLSHCCTAEYKKADRYEKKGKLPKLKKKPEKIAFIKGLMDADGWITKCRNGKYIKYTIAFKNTSKLSPLIYELMKDTGLVCGKFRLIKPQVRVINGRKYKPSKPAYEWNLDPHTYITHVGFGILRKQAMGSEYLKDRGYVS